ncbi:MAG TPA: sugar phosphate isomerase/epimerase family protein [Lacipirellulaceae bacterium]
MNRFSIDRRSFVLSALAGTAAFSQTSAHAIAPIARTSGHHFKLSMAAYSYRDLLQAKPPKLTLVDFIDDCARFGLDGTELTSYYLPQQPSEEYLRQLKGEAFRRGLDISGTAVGNDFCFPPGAERDKQIASVKRWIEYADMMDAPVIRIFAGAVKPEVSTDDSRRLAVNAINECCAHASKYGIFLALENHGGITAEADGVLAIVRAIESPWFGVNLDTGNFHTDDVYRDLTKLAPYSVNVQIKASISPAGGAKQPTDFKRLAAILQDAGYRGYIVLEFEERGDPRTECRRYIEQMREAFT